MYMTDSEDFHRFLRFLVSGLEQVVFDGAVEIGKENILIFSAPVVHGITVVKPDHIAYRFPKWRPCAERFGPWPTQHKQQMQKLSPSVPANHTDLGRCACAGLRSGIES